MSRRRYRHRGVSYSFAGRVRVKEAYRMLRQSIGPGGLDSYAGTGTDDERLADEMAEAIMKHLNRRKS